MSSVNPIHVTALWKTKQVLESCASQTSSALMEVPLPPSRQIRPHAKYWKRDIDVARGLRVQKPEGNRQQPTSAASAAEEKETSSTKN